MRFLFLIFLLLVIGCKSESRTDLSITDNEEKTLEISADSLEVYDFEGLKTYLNREDGKTYIVNFWATWCAPCVKELPYFEQIGDNFSKETVEVILVSLDFPSKYESNLKPFIIEKKLKSKVVALNDTDSNSWIPKIDKDWSGAIPATIIYNKNKREFYEKSFTYTELEKEVKQFLN